MHRIFARHLLILATALVCMTAARAATIESQYTVLHGIEAEKALHQCSRPVPEGIKGLWDPSEAVVHQLESRLPQLAKLASENSHSASKSIGDSTATYRQYIGVVIGDRRYVYINAWTAGELRMGSDGTWRYKASVVCDGGPSHWGALYDPQTGTFSALEMNGVA